MLLQRIIFVIILILFNLAKANDSQVLQKNDANNENIVQEKVQKSESKSEEKDLKDDEPELELLDQIEAEIISFSEDGSEKKILTMQNVRQRAFDGNKYTTQDLIDQTLCDNFSKFLKISVSNDDINRYLKKMNLTEKDVKGIAEHWDYPNVDAFYEDLKRTYRANGAIKFEIDSQLTVSEDEIKSEYDATPVYEEAYYMIENAFIPLSKDVETLKAELQNYAQGKIKRPDYVNWQIAAKVLEAEIPEQNKFLFDLPVDEIYIKEMPDGFDLFKIKRKQPRTLVSMESRKSEIVPKIQQAKYPTVYENVLQKLRSKSLIYRPDQEFVIPTKLKDLI